MAENQNAGEAESSKVALSLDIADPAPRPFDASLFDQGDTEKPTSPSFPAESPFMATADTPNVEEATGQFTGSGEEVTDDKAESGFDDVVERSGKPVTAANYFVRDDSLTQSSGSFFDSFTTARADDNNLFSTPPSSIGATPLSPEGPGFNIMEDPLGVKANNGEKLLDAGGLNSETVSIDSANLLSEDDRKLGSGTNLDTMSMDSTNLLSEVSEEDKDDRSVDHANNSFEIKSMDDDQKKAGEGDGERADQDLLNTTIDLETPEVETILFEDSISKASTETLADTPKNVTEVLPDSPLKSSESESTKDELSAQIEEVDINSDVQLPVDVTELDAPPLERELLGENPGVAATQSMPTTPMVESQERNEGDSPEKALGHPPSLMSSFSAPSGLVNPNPRAPFMSSSSQDGDDPFVAALRSSESDRRHDAWLPSEATLTILANRSIALQGSEYVSRDQLTMPGIISEEPQGDPVRDLIHRYMGEQESGKRSVLTLNQVTRDEVGLKRLLDAGCLRAAIDLTGLLLTAGGQGKGQSGMPSRHTPHLMQVWFTRISLYMKLQQFPAAEQEMEFFGDLDKPDLFFEYYPDLYPGRKGSIVPFSFRVIHAELPMYSGKHQVCLDRLSAILSVCHRIIQNLQDGKSEYGQPIELSAENRKASLDLWKAREARILHSIGNCLVSMKEYMQAVNVFKTLVEKEPDNEINITCGIARVYLQLGDLKAAQEIYTDVEKKLTAAGGKTNQARIHVNRGFLKVAQNQFAEAYKHFNEALKIEPDNFMAINNISVCCLYLGKLKEALSLLENLVNNDSSQYLDESLIFNLCTLYELESSKSLAKKQNLLGLVSKHKGDGFNISCLKMP